MLADASQTSWILGTRTGTYGAAATRLTTARIDSVLRSCIVLLIVLESDEGVVDSVGANID